VPVVPHSELPAFDRLAGEGVVVGRDASLIDLRIGLLNLMPDAALTATDRQFIRLVSGYGERANLFVYPFTLAAGQRSEVAQSYVSEHYSEFGDLRAHGLDALIITGANPTHFELADEPFWDGLIEVLDWAEEGVHSALCSCLATHAVLEHRGLVKRTKLPEKRWGVYQHQAIEHPLLKGLDDSIEAPHSHWFDITREEMEDVGLRVLAFSDEAGVHMASSTDGLSFVFFQGHPEYDDISLAKEYKREVFRHLAGDRDDYPPFPEHYFDEQAHEVLERYRTHLLSDEKPQPFPEEEVLRRWRPDWFDQGQTIYANWLTEVARRVES
jgi:homoserine O-succinyltransferase